MNTLESKNPFSENNTCEMYSFTVADGWNMFMFIRLFQDENV